MKLEQLEILGRGAGRTRRGLLLCVLEALKGRDCVFLVHERPFKRYCANLLEHITKEIGVDERFLINRDGAWSAGGWTVGRIDIVPISDLDQAGTGWRARRADRVLWDHTAEQAKLERLVDEFDPSRAAPKAQ